PRFARERGVGRGLGGEGGAGRERLRLHLRQEQARLVQAGRPQRVGHGVVLLARDREPRRERVLAGQLAAVGEAAELGQRVVLRGLAVALQRQLPAAPAPDGGGVDRPPRDG